MMDDPKVPSTHILCGPVVVIRKQELSNGKSCTSARVVMPAMSFR